MKNYHHIILLVALFIFFNQHLCAKTGAPNEYILILTSISYNEEWSNNFKESICDEFKNKFNVLSDELMIPSLKSMEQVNQLQNYLLDKYPTRPKIVIYIGDPGWIATKQLFDNEWKDVPTIICFSREFVPNGIESLISDNNGIEKLVRKDETLKGYNVLTIEQKFFVKETIDMMSELLPNMNKIAFIHDKRYISLSVRKELADIAQTYYPSLEIEYLSSPELNSEQLLEKIASYDSNTGILYYSWLNTRSDDNLKLVTNNISKVLFGFSKTPIFALSDQNLETGHFAGGYYISQTDISKKAIHYIYTILNNKAITQNVVNLDPSQAIKHLNYQHLQYHNINPEIYPKDALYYQVPPSFFEKYKLHIISTALIILSALIILVILIVFYIQKYNQRIREVELSAKYRRLIDNMPVVYVRKKLIKNEDNKTTDFVFIEINPAFEKVFDCKRAEIIDKRLTQLIDRYPKFKFFSDDNQGREYTFCIKDHNNNETYYDQLEFSESDNEIIDTFIIVNLKLRKSNIL